MNQEDPTPEKETTGRTVTGAKGGPSAMDAVIPVDVQDGSLAAPGGGTHPVQPSVAATKSTAPLTCAPPEMSALFTSTVALWQAWQFAFRCWCWCTGANEAGGGGGGRPWHAVQLGATGGFGQPAKPLSALPWKKVTVVPVTVSPLRSGTSSAACRGSNPRPVNRTDTAPLVLLNTSTFSEMRDRPLPELPPSTV